MSFVGRGYYPYMTNPLNNENRAMASDEKVSGSGGHCLRNIQPSKRDMMSLGHDSSGRQEITRRGLLKWGTLLCSFTTAIGLGGILQSYLSAGQADARPRRISAGRWEDFAVGTVTERQGIYLLKDEAGLFAFKGECPHLGCRFQWVEDQNIFECPCHGSQFESNGSYISGPARKPLDRIELRFSSAGEIIADTWTSVSQGFRLHPA
ncbi:MAG: Rieske (2Fe-2S) protein [bacterium]|nr:Rieske (2Fe-2S) protein [bacterium]